MKEEILNKRVEQVLQVKSDLGLFSNPFTDPNLVTEVVNSKAHQELAYPEFLIKGVYKKATKQLGKL